LCSLRWTVIINQEQHSIGCWLIIDR